MNIDSGTPCSFGIRFLRFFRPYDVLSISFLLCITILIFLFHHNVGHWHMYVLYHVFLIAFVIMIRVVNGFQSTFLRFTRDLYSFLLLFFLFEEMERFTHLLFPDWKSHILIAADHFMFGAHPTVWLENIVSHPLTECLECIYLSYYVLLPVGGFLYYFLARREAFEGTLTAVAMAFYLCFIGYVLLPAEGPWKTLAELQTVDIDASLFREVVATIQSRAGIIGGCFPSAHVSVACAVVASSFFYVRKIFYPLVLYSILLAFATVYGRYHYAIDSLVGLAIGLVAGILAMRLNGFWAKKMEFIEGG